MAQGLDQLARKNLGPCRRNEMSVFCWPVKLWFRPFAATSDSAREEWEGDEALICTCFCVSERTIEAQIQRRSLKNNRRSHRGV